MIKAEHISKSYRQGFFSSRKQEVVLDISFHMKKGTTFGLLGSSGQKVKKLFVLAQMKKNTAER